MAFSACVIDLMFALSPLFIAHSESVAFVKSIPYCLTFIPLLSQYLKGIRLYHHQKKTVFLRSLLTLRTSDGANLHPTPLRDSRYTFLPLIGLARYCLIYTSKQNHKLICFFLSSFVVLQNVSCLGFFLTHH